MQDAFQITAVRSESPKKREKTAFELTRGIQTCSKEVASRPGCFSSDNIVPVNHRSNAHSGIAVLHSRLHADNLSLSADKHL